MPRPKRKFDTDEQYERWVQREQQQRLEDDYFGKGSELVKISWVDGVPELIY